MAKKRFSPLFSITIILVMLFSLVHTGNARADDSTPPAATEEPTQPVDEQVEEETASDSTPEPEVGAADPESTPEPDASETETPQEESTEEAEELDSPAEILDATPQGTDVIVLDENGEPLPLVTQEAADILIEGDPMWCPENVLPGGPGCTTGYTTFSALIADLAGGTYSGNGTIYVAYDYDETLEGNINIDHNNGNLVNLDDLVIQGGWDFVSNTMFNDDATYQSILGNNSLNITNWVGNLTVNNIFLDGGAIYIPNAANDVNLNNVTVQNADYTSGIYINSGGDVSLDHVGSYNNGHGYDHDPGNYLNSYDGIGIDADGDITLTDVASSYNANTGAILNSYHGSVFVTDSTFIGNGEIGNLYIQSFDSLDIYYFAGDGLEIEAEEDVILDNVIVNDNAGDGANIYADLGDISITGSQFNNNGWGGNLFGNETIYLDVMDSIAAFCDGKTYESLAFNPCADSEFVNFGGANFEYSINIYVDEEDGDYQNDYFITQQGGTGLDAESESGSITLQTVQANSNAGDGVYLNAEGNVFVTGNSEFNGNGEYGYLYVGECLGYGLVSCFGFGEQPVDFALGVGMEFSYGDGIHADADGNITIADITANDNYNNGALFHSDGSVFVENGQFLYNGYPVVIGGEGGLFGYYLYDMIGLMDGIPLPVSEFGFMFGLGAAGEPEPTELGLFAELYFSSGTGLEVGAYNDINLINVIASNNMGTGADLYTDGNIFVTNSDFYNNGSGFSGGAGLYAYLGESTGYLEGGFGISNGSGLYANAGGDITLSSVYANNNALYGAELYSDATNSVFVEYSQFNNNGYSGALGPGIWLEGYFYLDEIDSGFEIDDYYGSGLYIESEGNVTLNFVEASNNFMHGAEVYSNGGTVVVNCGAYNNNGFGMDDGYGVYEGGASALELYGPEILNNFYSPDEYYFSNSVTVSEECTLPPGTPTSGTTSEGGSCPEGGRHLFIMDNSDWASFPCPINDFAYTRTVLEDKLPAPLPDTKPNEPGGEYIYRSALDTDLFRNGEFIDLNDRSVVVSFLIPSGVDVESLAIIYWNGNEWIELDGYVTDIGPDGKVVEGRQYFQVSTLHVGTFVLVTK